MTIPFFEVAVFTDRLFAGTSRRLSSRRMAS
jgi:hypothetical protein